MSRKFRIMVSPQKEYSMLHNIWQCHLATKMFWPLTHSCCYAPSFSFKDAVFLIIIFFMFQVSCHRAWNKTERQQCLWVTETGLGEYWLGLERLSGVVMAKLTNVAFHEFIGRFNLQ